MIPFININGKKIGTKYPPYIIAEMSANHNGNIDIAHELIRQARLAGADVAKFQFYDP